MNIENILNQIKDNLDNPDWLSRSLSVLSSALFYHNTEMAHAEVDEKKLAVKYMNTKKDGRKLMTVSESEKRAVVETNNRYGVLKAQGEAIKESINAIKKRIEVLSWERQLII